VIDAQEGPEPNGLGFIEPSDAQAGNVTLKGVGNGAFVVHGSIDPWRDINSDGTLEPDVDTYLVTTDVPTFLRITADGVGGTARNDYSRRQAFNADSSKYMIAGVDGGAYYLYDAKNFIGVGGKPVDQQTLETRAYAVARALDPLLVNTVVGFIGPEYLYDGKQIIRAGLEDHFCGKLLGLPMGVDVCHTNHAEADQDDMDTLLTLLGVAGCTYVMGVPGADDVMLSYQSSSFHDALYLRRVLGKRPAPEFETWLERVGITDRDGNPVGGERSDALPAPLRRLAAAFG